MSARNRSYRVSDYMPNGYPSIVGMRPPAWSREERYGRGVARDMEWAETQPDEPGKAGIPGRASDHNAVANYLLTLIIAAFFCAACVAF